MKEAEIPGHFDGRGRVEFGLSGLEAGQSDTITAIGFEFGYDLVGTEVRSRSTMSLVFVRNDSPTARQRAVQTHDRLRAGGPLLMAWAVQAPGEGQAAPQTTLTAVELASKRRGLAAYESNGIRGLVVLVAVLSVGCLVLAWALRHGPFAAVVLAALFAVALAVLAAFVPSLTRRWYEKNRRLVDLYDQQRAGGVGPPPPPPGFPPSHYGQGG
ncbi:hypothetical protein [Streptomyces sp. NPDC059224]|uniref:hypothetical protein n=1 Tax=Streptomyces sp. NPDC059224 TaxID=3346775 RepID=UPI0036CBE295